MRKTAYALLLCLAALFVPLQGCGSHPAVLGEGYMEGQDQQIMYQIEHSFTVMAESTNGYYFMVQNFLYYMDKDSMNPVVMCGKPDCLHEKESDPKRIWKCAGHFFHDTSKFIAWYDGNLYVSVVQDQEARKLGDGALIRVSPDGTKREEVVRFSEKPGCMAVHRGILYYASATYDLGLNADYRIRSVPLDGGEDRILYQGNRESGTIQTLWCYGNQLYFNEIFSQNGEPDFQWQKIDLRSGDVTPLQDHQYIMGIQSDGLGSQFGSYQNPDRRQLYKSGFDGENKEPWFTLEKGERYYSDGIDPYIYTPSAYYDDLPFTLKKLDPQGNLVGRVDMTGLTGFQDAFMPGGKDHLFFSQLDEEQHYHLYSVSKAELSTGVAQPREVIEIEEQETTAVFG